MRSIKRDVIMTKDDSNDENDNNYKNDEDNVDGINNVDVNDEVRDDVGDRRMFDVMNERFRRIR